MIVKKKNENEESLDQLDGLLFGIYGSEEIRNLSACQITNPVTFNALGHPTSEGLYDFRLGPYSEKKSIPCGTCGLLYKMCPGHMGHIELPYPVFNPIFYATILKIIRLSCLHCHAFKIPILNKKIFLMQQILLDQCKTVKAEEVSATYRSCLVKASKSKDIGDEEKNLRQAQADKHERESMIFIDEFLSKQLNSVRKFKNNNRSVETLRSKYVSNFYSVNTNSKSKCSNCNSATKSIVLYKGRFIYEGEKLNDDEEEDETDKRLNLLNSNKKVLEKMEVNALELRDHFRELWNTDSDLISYLFPMLRDSSSSYPTDIFFLDVIPVPPVKVRPCQFAGDNMTIHGQSSALQSVVENSIILNQMIDVVNKVDGYDTNKDTLSLLSGIKGSSNELKLTNVWRELQKSVDHVIDNDLNSSRFDKKTWGFKQLIEKKTGLFRMHMMGKRVNFAARTVITPDPNIDVNEVGLPEIFAKKLTYKVPVTSYNVEDLRELVSNGPKTHPGALYIESEKGGKKMIDADNEAQRQSMAKTLMTPSSESKDTKYIYRHLKNGDSLLLNRQPSLHKPSIMGHRARILKEDKVMRLHYACCKSYNADFDGDEMNAHFPQSEIGRSEARSIVDVSNQYLVPKDGTPLQGLIQDHIIAGVKMTTRGRFFTKAEYQQHLYSAIINKKGFIRTLPPTILKPEPLWSGKQIISSIILNSLPEGKSPPTLHSTTKIKPQDWSNGIKSEWNVSRLKSHSTTKGCKMCESEVIISEGELLCGIMDKNQYGATMYSLVHVFFELYGGAYSCGLLSAFSKIFTNFLHTEGFTLGVSDILVQEYANKERKKTIEEISKVGDKCAALAVCNPTDQAEGDVLKFKLENFHKESMMQGTKLAKIDQGYKEKLGPMNNIINKTCLPLGLIKKFPDNNLQLMVQAGAKGSTVNTMYISCLLGQIELEGKRPPIMISGKSLPSFVPYETKPRSGGFIEGRFMTGIKPQEFFFHCMAGREGLIDTAVKTSRSGYLQRCLVKLLEGLVVNYDMTVRDSDSSVIQFQYGEDGLDVCKSQYLVPSQIEFLNSNKNSIIDKKMTEKIKKSTDTELSVIENYKTKVKKKLSKTSESIKKDSPFLKFSRKNHSNLGLSVECPDGRTPLNTAIINAWRAARTGQKGKRVPDPCISVLRPDRNYGSVSEKMQDLIDSSSTVIKQDIRQEFREMMYFKYMKSMADPGEPVGVLAAQSVGEPSTQMTLNTFHFAGRGDMNVTLGIPRLREILMVASAAIKTPSCTVPFLPSATPKAREALRLRLNRCTLGNIIQNVNIIEKNHLQGTRNLYSVTPDSVLTYFENKYILKILVPHIATMLTDTRVVIESKADKTTISQNNDENDDDQENAHVETKGDSSEDEGLNDDADATDAKKKQRQQDDDYDEDEELELSDSELKIKEETEDVSDVEDIKVDNKLTQENKNYQMKRSYVLSFLQDRSHGAIKILDYDFDHNAKSWAEITISYSLFKSKVDMSNVVKKTASSAVIHEVPKINRGIIITNKNQEDCIVTEGINIEALFKYEKILNLNKLSCNDIHEMARLYGIEAASKTIIYEIVNVFKAYGITVNNRHLNLIADFMTFDGVYKPFNRIGIQFNSSPLQQMTFETAMNFLRSATLGARYDSLQSPSSCLVVGKTCVGGTGTFSLLQKLPANN